MHTAHRPPGSGPALASACQVPRRRRRGVAVPGRCFLLGCHHVRHLARAFLALGGRHPGPDLRPGHRLAVTQEYSCAPGRAGCPGGRANVQTDRLTALQAEDTVTGVCFAMRDAGSRSVRLRPSEISRNPDVWQLVRAGIQESCSAGLTVDAPTSHYFAL